MDRSALRELEQYLDLYLSSSLLVVRDGYLVWEKYWRAYLKETTFESFSVTKSFTSALGNIFKDGRTGTQGLCPAGALHLALLDRGP